MFYDTEFVSGKISEGFTEMKNGKPFKLDDFDSEVEMWELLNTQREVIIDLEEKVNEQDEIIRQLEKENRELERFRYLIFKRMGELMEKKNE